jgi:hypothetical protein
LTEILEAFAGLDLNDTRRRVEEQWRVQVADAPNGWSVAAADPAGVATAFGLEVRPGLRLVSVVYRWERDGEGFVVALPEDGAAQLLEEGLPDELAETDELGPEEFPSATPLGEALDGDGSPLSHVMASIATREMLALGQRGHGIGWPDELLVQDGADEPVLPPGDPSPPAWVEWTRVAGAGGPWFPAVVRDDAVVVQFHTVSGRGGWRMLRWVDRYEDESSYAFTTESSEVAEAPGGWLH